MFQPPVEKCELAELILSKEKQKKNKKTELLDWKCMTSRILSQNATIIAISALRCPQKKIKTEIILSRINILDCWGWLAWAPRANVGTKSLIRKIWVSEYSCLYVCVCVCVCVCLCFSLIQPSVQALKYAIGGHVWAYGTSRWPFRALTKKISEDIRNGQKSTWKQQIFENF